MAKKSSSRKSMNGTLHVKKFHLATLLLFAVAFGGIGAVILRGSFAATPCRSQAWAQGSSGQCVTDIQVLVNYLSRSNIATDGYYGPQTRQAIINLQNKYRAGFTDPQGYYRHNPTMINDGIVRPGTYMCPYLSKGLPYYPWGAAMNYGCVLVG